MSEKPIYAPLPVRALGDARLSGAHLRVLAATSAHDRFAKNGTGCFASYRRLAAMTGLSMDAVKHAIADLAGWGYLRIETNPIDARRRILFVEFTAEDGEAMRGDGRSFTKGATPRLARIGAETNTDCASAPRRKRSAGASKVGAETNTEKASIGVEEKIQVVEIVDFPERNIFPDCLNQNSQRALASFLTSTLMDAMSIHASDEAMVFSQSLANLRHRPSQAKVRSTTQRLAMTTKPLA